MIRYLGCFLAAAAKSKSRLAAENLCLRQQLVVLKRRQARPRIRPSISGSGLPLVLELA